MKRPNLMSSSLSPGPVYLLKQSVGRNKDVVFKHNPTYGFGTSERPDPAGNKFGRTPGPGEYQTGQLVGPSKPPPYKTAPSFGFGTSARLPGETPHQKRMDRSLLQSLEGSLDQALDDQPPPVVDMELEPTPGPGQYDDAVVVVKKRHPAYSFGTSAQRPGPTARASKLPGPGQYKACETVGERTAPTHRKGPSFGFGTAKLGSRLKDGQFPGPGSYDAPSAFDTQSYSVHRTLPKFTFGSFPRETGIYD
eukprot:CAMPEP_0113682590 /NCGR_PEP_ID=MMETSP0038_2-20120614/12764_1 /TAXON_ID=2898 /ORGANISM="Cryptomonas paramecium" /LENGTH=249 /DNA_ID=CAMNT_0000601709 /DNA_START=172 /DNA_END=921 /DNA_ORIENTATION=- /assembly_acc=CAM_ASM_000170